MKKIITIIGGVIVVSIAICSVIIFRGFNSGNKQVELSEQEIIHEDNRELPDNTVSQDYLQHYDTQKEYNDRVIQEAVRVGNVESLLNPYLDSEKHDGVLLCSGKDIPGNQLIQSFFNDREKHEIMVYEYYDLKGNFLCRIKRGWNQYGSKNGMPGSVSINTKNWITKKDKAINFSFTYPKNTKLITENGCYRIEYKKGYVFLLLPTEGGDRCGARTGVGDVPNDAYFDDYLRVSSDKYKFSGFRSISETSEEYDDGRKEIGISYDFHHSAQVNKYCNDEKNCLRVGYGIYTESISEKIGKEEIDETMDTLRAIVQSIE